MIEIRHQQIVTPLDESKAYDQIYADQGIRHLDSLYLWILNLLNVQPGQKLIDISSGEGTLVYFAQKRGLVSFGIDFSPVALKKGIMDYGLSSSVAASDAECLPIADKSCDYITNIGSVEHYFRPEIAVREMSRVLKPDGVACILLPNAYSLFGNVKYVWQFGEVFDDGQPLQRYNTRIGWSQVLTNNGLQPFKIVKYERERPLTTKDLVWYLRRPMKLLKLLISPFVPLNLSNSIVYLCHSAAAK
jgi:SAM-dependent methyltransferase